MKAKNKRLRQLFVCSKLLPKLQKGGHAAILHTIYANYTILATQREAMAQCPPLNTPLETIAAKYKNVSIYDLR